MEAAAAPATAANFMDHVAAQDIAPSGGDDNAIPDHSPQVSDQPEVEKPAQTSDDDLEGLDDQAEQLADPAEEFIRNLKAELDAGPGLPESLRDRTVPVKINGHTYDVAVSELAQGYQRQSDYTKKLGEVKALEKEVNAMKGGVQAFVNDLRNPETFAEACKELDLYDAFIAAARKEGRKRLQLRELSPDAQQYALQLEQERDARAREARRVKQYEAEVQNLRRQQPNEDQLRAKHQLEQMVPRAMEKFKVADYPLSRELFSKNLETLYEGGDITTALVEAAAQATAEQLADIALRLPKAPANDNGNPAGQTLAARRTPGAPGKPMPRLKGGTANDFAAHLERLNGSR